MLGAWRRASASFFILSIAVCTAAGDNGDRERILLAVIEYEMTSLDERNSHFIAWPKVRDRYHVFVAVGPTEPHDPDPDTLVSMATIPRIHRRSDAEMENPEKVVREKGSHCPGEILWVKEISIISEAEAEVSADMIAAEWCKTGLTFRCKYESGKWQVTSRTKEWQQCESPPAASP